MSNSRVFWGVLLLVLGGLFLVDRLDLYHIHWSFTWKLWPLLLIFWGAALMFGKGKIGPVIAGAAGLGIAVLFFGMVGQAWGWTDGEFVNEENQQQLTQSFDPGITHATLTFESGAGSFRIKDTTAQLVEATTHSTFGNYSIEHDRENHDADVRIWFDGHSGKHWGNQQNSATVYLNPNPLWNVHVKIGAAKLEIDLAKHRVEKLDIEMGASNAHVRLGALAEQTEVNVQEGASSITIEVPEKSGCEVHLESALSSKSLPDFDKVGEQTYRTPGYENATHTVVMNIHGGVSSIHVSRY